MASRVLIVEDEPDIRDLLAFHLERDGYQVTKSKTGADALRQLKSGLPDLVLLDLMLPEVDGLEVCRRLRQDPRTASLPIVMLTAKGEEVDRILGLELGADDYIVKPFSPKEVVARVRAVLRRSRTPSGTAPIASGRLTIDLGRHTVDVGGQPSSSSPRRSSISSGRSPRRGAASSPASFSSTASGATRRRGRSSRGRWTSTCAGFGSSSATKGQRITTVKGVGYRLETGG